MLERRLEKKLETIVTNKVVTNKVYFKFVVWVVKNKVWINCKIVNQKGWKKVRKYLYIKMFYNLKKVLDSQVL